jgi:aldehyde dehydrogenase (NAD+)
MWYFGSAEGCQVCCCAMLLRLHLFTLLLQYIEHMSVESVKRTWVDYGEFRDWADEACGQGEEFLVRSTEPKNIWIPAGVSFGN